MTRAPLRGATRPTRRAPPSWRARLALGAGDDGDRGAPGRSPRGRSRPACCGRWRRRRPGGTRSSLLWTYLYATTQLAMPLVADRTVLVPLAHDEPMLRFGLTRGLVRIGRGPGLHDPRGAAAGGRPPRRSGGRPEAVVGAGLDPAPAGDGRARPGAAGRCPARFALYLGRVDAAKGVDALVRAHDALPAAAAAIARAWCWPGGPTVDLRLPDWVRDRRASSTSGTRADLLDACEVVVLPSPHESLSLVALEAWRGRAADAGHGALRGARRPDGPLGRRPALRRRPQLRAPARAARRRPGAARACSARAGAAWAAELDLGRLRRPLARAAGARRDPAAGALRRMSPISRCQARSVDHASTRPA